VLQNHQAISAKLQAIATKLCKVAPLSLALFSQSLRDRLAIERQSNDNRWASLPHNCRAIAARSPCDTWKVAAQSLALFFAIAARSHGSQTVVKRQSLGKFAAQLPRNCRAIAWQSNGSRTAVAAQLPHNCREIVARLPSDPCKVAAQSLALFSQSLRDRLAIAQQSNDNRCASLPRNCRAIAQVCRAIAAQLL
jgi:hypothetical protein